jgi:hypothetical protein
MASSTSPFKVDANVTEPSSGGRAGRPDERRARDLGHGDFLERPTEAIAVGGNSIRTAFRTLVEPFDDASPAWPPTSDPPSTSTGPNSAVLRDLALA